ncbi:MAG TPA: hypothetical protein VFQ71_09855 [Gaiellales bacterium]|jgi:hypothetical protein|nr:hypothetical protein [Gaiellales bacterium]
MGRPRLPVVLATAAVVWSLGLLAAAFLVPLYSGEMSSATVCTSSAAHCTTTQVAGSDATLAQVNGGRLMLTITGFLIACTLIAWLGLHFRCTQGSRIGTVVAWAASVLVIGFSAVSFGLGLLTWPMAGMMAFAAARTPAGRRSS